uniref:Carboxylesterase type B domain-containing protein n=1 Tax=Panagrolaimus davidi TaxID=227884 RepID=A0A914QN70_9BILA
MGCGVSSNNNVYPRPEAVTEYGKINGKHFVLKDGRVADVFLGIPFAKPPVGELRFEKPQAPEPWEKIKSTIKYKNRPIQQDYFWDRIQSGKSKSEDCLYLNIMTPNWNPSSSTKGFPVMFYIHGGGYSVDSDAKIPYENICK